MGGMNEKEERKVGKSEAQNCRTEIREQTKSKVDNLNKSLA